MNSSPSGTKQLEAKKTSNPAPLSNYKRRTWASSLIPFRPQDLRSEKQQSTEVFSTNLPDTLQAQAVILHGASGTPP